MKNFWRLRGIPASLTTGEFHSLLRKLLPVLLVICICGGLSSRSVAQRPFEEGKKWYDLRAAEADSFRAKPEYIEKAILAFENALQNDIRTVETAEYLLKSYYFKGMYLGLNKKKQKQVYDKGKQLGERMMERYPGSVPIKFWYSANSGRWADVHGFIAAATSGTAKKLRSICQDIINLDPEYQGGGGYRILGQVHFYSPNIPLIMGWPSDKKALNLLKKAIQIAPEHPTNLLLYARILLRFDRSEEAKPYLSEVLALEPRSTNLVEDRYVKDRARKLMDEHFE